MNSAHLSIGNLKHERHGVIFMQEIWKDISGYEGIYQVSNFGNIKSLERYFPTKNPKKPIAHINEKILKLRTDKKGYLNVGLTKNGKFRTIQVHRIVAEAFIPNPENMPQVNHKDENKSNNNVNNLEWCSRKYNCNYGTRNLKIGKSSCKNRVIQCDLEGNPIKIFKNGKEAGLAFGKDPSSIYACCVGKQLTAFGYRWCHEGKTLVLLHDCCKCVLKYDEKKHLIAKYSSMKECYKNNNISPHTLRKYANTNKIFKGYYWELL